MRERIDCAVLLSGTDRAGLPELRAAEYLGGRLVLHAVGEGMSSDQFEAGLYLRDQAMALRRYDLCILAITPANLPWARRLLSAAQSVCATPVLAVVEGLKATAINDLMSLGLADFVRMPVCYDEIRARAHCLISRGVSAAYATDVSCGHEATGIAEPAAAGVSGALGLPLVGRTALASFDSRIDRADPALSSVGIAAAVGMSEQDICDTILQRTGLELDAYAVASAARSATSKESFRAAKGKIIERFERAYIAAALVRCSGNIAMAARAAQKHRRAFWALMRKYQIDASAFRTEASAKFSPGG